MVWDWQYKDQDLDLLQRKLHVYWFTIIYSWFSYLWGFFIQIRAFGMEEMHSVNGERWHNGAPTYCPFSMAISAT